MQNERTTYNYLLKRTLNILTGKSRKLKSELLRHCESERTNAYGKFARSEHRFIEVF